MWLCMGELESESVNIGELCNELLWLLLGMYLTRKIPTLLYAYPQPSPAWHGYKIDLLLGILLAMVNFKKDIFEMSRIRSTPVR